MMREINWQLAYLRRLPATTPPMLPRPPLADAACARPLELLSQLHETVVELFNELTVGGNRAVHARLETAPRPDVFPTMGDPALLDGLLVNLFTNSFRPCRKPDAVEITPYLHAEPAFCTAITGPACRRMPAACCWRASGPLGVAG